MPRNSGEKETPSVAAFFFLILLVVLTDQATKFLALAFLGEESRPVLPGIFHLTLVYNSGVAFGLFQNRPSLLFAAITLSLAFLFLWARELRNLTRQQRWGLALILGGALGNWIDRARLGSVVDFLDFRVWPVFNLADTAITVGVGLYLLILLRKPSP